MNKLINLWIEIAKCPFIWIAFVKGLIIGGIIVYLLNG